MCLQCVSHTHTTGKGQQATQEPIPKLSTGHSITHQAKVNRPRPAVLTLQSPSPALRDGEGVPTTVRVTVHGAPGPLPVNTAASSSSRPSPSLLPSSLPPFLPFFPVRVHSGGAIDLRATREDFLEEEALGWGLENSLQVGKRLRLGVIAGGSRARAASEMTKSQGRRGRRAESVPSGLQCPPQAKPQSVSGRSGRAYSKGGRRSSFL